ncbi:hypothetical protein UlMin_003382 [Ulmus minor]
MEKMLALISLYHSLCSRSYRIYSADRTLFNLSALPTSSTSHYSLTSSECRSPLSKGLGLTRFYSEDNELPDVVINDVKAALSKNTDDKVDKEVVANIFHAAEVVVEFCDMVMNLKMELDDIVGMSGENREVVEVTYSFTPNVIHCSCLKIHFTGFEIPLSNIGDYLCASLSLRILNLLSGNYVIAYLII